MAKGMLGPLLEAGLKEFRGRSEASQDKAASTHSTPSRRSILSSVRLPSLRRQDASEETPTHDKTPLLTLVLSSNSFLDSVIKDDVSKAPLYAIKTSNATTIISRTDASGSSVRMACLKWPKVLPTRVKGKEVSDGIMIQMRGNRWNGGESLLKQSSSSKSAQKFNIPNYSQPMKWKRCGSVYWCTTSSVKGPVAILEMPRDKNPTKLTVFETLHDKYDPRALLTHQGVSIVLLDFLLVTALLLVTDLQEWMLVRKYEGKSLIVPNPSPGFAAEIEASTSDSQWRKIMYGEPLYPKLSGESSSNISHTSASPPSHLPPTPTSARHRNPPYGQVVSPSVQHEDESILSMSSDSEDEDEDDLNNAVTSTAQTRAPSPSAESVCYPVTNASAPSHGYIDPSFYPKNRAPRVPRIPPVPSLPPQYAKSTQSLTDVAMSSPASSSSHSRPIRGLPQPPAVQPYPSPNSIMHLRLPSANGLGSDSSSRYDSHASSPRGSADSALNRSRSATHRPAARPLPSVPSSDNSDVKGVRRIRSHAVLVEEPSTFSPSSVHSRRPQRSLPPTPRDGALTSPVTAGIGQQNDHRQAPPRTKHSEEDLTHWVHTLTSPSRDLPALPLPRTTIFDVPPPAYNSITFSRRPPTPPPVPRLPPMSEAS